GRATQSPLLPAPPARFTALPQAHQLVDEAVDADPTAVEPTDSAPADAQPNEEALSPAASPEPRRCDRLGWLATAAGYDDGERFWEQLVEHRRGDDEQLFASVASVMTELRAEHVAIDKRREDQREAHMRRSIRNAQREGFKEIAVVCGAWHAPALTDMPPAAHDAALLKGLPKAK